jgi:hypothetical protein
MAENSRVSKDKQSRTDQKHHAQQQDSRPVFEDIRAWGHDLLSLAETPFNPPMDEHAEFLAAAPPGPPLTNFIQHLQRTYGNAYVQRLLKHDAVQVANAQTSAAGDDVTIDSGQHLTGTVEMKRPLPYQVVVSLNSHLCLERLDLNRRLLKSYVASVKGGGDLPPF